jgi:zinc transporter 2
MKESLEQPLLPEALFAPCSHIHDEYLAKANMPARNVNLHAAYIHALADLAQAIAVLIAGVIIWNKPTWQLADPICTLLFSVLIFGSTIGIIKSSLYLLLEKVPPGIQWDEINNAICGVPGVSNVHQLKIWSVSHGEATLSVHATAENVEQAYNEIRDIGSRHHISKLTLQIQPTSISGECVTCAPQLRTC